MLKLNYKFDGVPMSVSFESNRDMILFVAANKIKDEDLISVDLGEGLIDGGIEGLANHYVEKITREKEEEQKLAEEEAAREAEEFDFKSASKEELIEYAYESLEGVPETEINEIWDDDGVIDYCNPNHAYNIKRALESAGFHVTVEYQEPYMDFDKVLIVDEIADFKEKEENLEDTFRMVDLSSYGFEDRFIEVESVRQDDNEVGVLFDSGDSVFVDPEDRFYIIKNASEMPDIDYERLEDYPTIRVRSKYLHSGDIVVNM